MKSLILLATGSLMIWTSIHNMPADTDFAHADPAELVADSFERWRNGTGGPFELLADDATWTITGNSLAAGTYRTKTDFIDTVIKPFNARLTKPLVPVVRGLHADGGTIIVRFDGEALAADGAPYRNSYAWFLEMDRGRIVRATAFFDAIAFDEFWNRVQPDQNT